MDAVMELHNLCLFPMAEIPQVVQIPRLIFDFTWSGINEATKRFDPMEAM